MNNEKKNSAAGEQPKQKEERISDSAIQPLPNSITSLSIISYIPLITVSVYFVLFLSFHFLMNNSAEAEFMSSHNRLTRAHNFVELMIIGEVENEKDTRVFNLETGKLIDTTYYFKDEAGIIKITPDHKYRIKGSLRWRFFMAGFFKGEKNTPFTLRHWELGSKRMDGKPSSLLRKIYFDPTNPTPFYFLLALFIISIFAKRVVEKRGKRKGSSLFKAEEATFKLHGRFREIPPTFDDKVDPKVGQLSSESALSNMTYQRRTALMLIGSALLIILTSVFWFPRLKFFVKGVLNLPNYEATLTSLHAEQLKDGVNAYETRNYTEAYRIFKSLAEQGNAEAQNNLGLMYDQGKGVRKNEVEAFKWYRKAADQGYVLAQMNLGVFYHLGIGVPKDNVQAYKWLNLSAAKGNKEAIQAKGVVSKDMTSSQIEEAQKLANEWWEKYNK